MSQSHYIYLLFDVHNPNRYYSNEVNKIGRKIGSTCNIKMRMKPYLTGHPDKVPLECYYLIINYDKYTCYELDNMIKIEFDNYRLKASGGIEFYDANIVNQNVIETYFTNIGIQFKKETKLEYDDNIDMTEKDILDFSNDVNYHKKYKNVNNLLDKYIDQIKQREIIKKLQKSNNDVFDILYKIINNQTINYLQNLNIIDDQIEILLCSIIYYQIHNNGIWNLFCRYGKTILSCLFCKLNSYKKILILVPSLYLVNQTYNTWAKIFDKSNIIKICHTENSKNIDEFYTNDISIFISTYHSSEKLKHLLFDICIFDEAHRTVGIKSEELSFFKKQLENKNYNKKLFLTATLKEYTGDFDNYYTMDDYQIYGDIIASVSALRAKELKRICDYKIITIELESIDINIDIEAFFIQNNITKPEEKHHLETIKDKYLKCAVGLYNTMEKYKIKHLITFHDLIINCKFFSTILKIVSNYKYNINYIDGTTDNREELINIFQDIDYSILCSAKVLQEGVDIPKCDGVIFIDNKTSVIDTVQSLSRCLTVTNDISKIGHILIPYDNTANLIDDNSTNILRLILRNIIEIDENIKEFFNKLKVFNFNNMSHTDNTSLNELLVRYNIIVNSTIIKDYRDLSYATFNNARKLITNKYTHVDDYKLNVNNDFTNENLPIDANIIYKNIGWINWNHYLGLEEVISIRKIKSIIQRENENRQKHNIELIDSKISYEQFATNNLDLNLPISIDIEDGNWIKFCLPNYNELVKDYYTINELNIVFNKYKITNKEKYIEISKIDNKLVKYEYIANGFYYDCNNSFNINDIYFVEQKNIRRF